MGYFENFGKMRGFMNSDGEWDIKEGDKEPSRFICIKASKSN
jgi:hypothetical protein